MGDTTIVSVERLWIPLGDTYSVGQAGWLYHPTGDGMFVHTSRAVPLTSLVSNRCLVLLGEPGMGKSSTLKSHASLVESGNDVDEMRVDLANFSSEERLTRKVLDGPKITRWRNGNGHLCLTLDSFDEAHSRIDNLHRLLGEYLGEWDCERLLIRIACRTAQWPASMTAILKQHMGVVDSYELLPLRRTDAAAILSPRLDPEAFLNAVETAHVVPLAARPLTLKLLAATFIQSNTLPARSTELYESGLLTLCDEMNPERRDAARGSATPDAKRLLQAASRIAAFSTFSGRPTVWTGPTTEATSADLTVGDCTSTPGSDSDQHAFTTEDVLDTLHTGIFTGAGPQRLGWSHATFVDFLAARWVVQSGLNEDQVRSITVSRDGRLHPRMHQLAAWLVALKPADFAWLIAIDPEAFLRGVDIPSTELRAQIVTKLLAEASKGNLYHDYTYRFDVLKHDSLPEQLRQALSSLTGEECQIAIDIARQCELRTLEPDLAAIALNDQADSNLRISAALAVRAITEDSPTGTLAPLLKFGASVEVNIPHDQELEAAALMSSWPHAISTADVFERLGSGQPRNFVGLFATFVSSFALSLTESDLAPACTWIRNTEDWNDDSRLTELVDAILRLATNHLNRADAETTAVRIGLKRIDSYEPVFSSGPLAEQNEPTTEQRRTLALALLTQASEEQAFGIADTPPDSTTLLKSTDFAWLIDQYECAAGTLRDNLTKVISWTFSLSDRMHIDVVLGLAEGSQAAQLFTHWRDPVRLDSPEAEAGRESLRVRLERKAKRDSRRENPDGWIYPRITELAAKALGGDTAAFWASCRMVTIRPGTEHYMDEYQPDLMEHPRWNLLTEQTRQDLIASAATYLRDGDCAPEEWLLHEKRYYPAEAGYRAFLLILRDRPHELDSLDPGVWRKWAPILVSWTPAWNGARAEDKSALFKRAIPHAREELTHVLLQLVDVAIAADKPTFLREELTLLQSDTLCDELLERLTAGIPREPRNDILDSVLSSHPGRFYPLLTEWLQPEQRKTDQDRALDAAIRLLWAPNVPWSMFRELMSSDPDLAEQVFLFGSHMHERRPPDLTEVEIGDLYAWLTHHFPSEEDPQHDDAHWVGPRESVSSWRDSLLTYLTNLGTQASVSVIGALAEEFPDKVWLKRVLVTAKRAGREKSWEPVALSHLDELAAERTSRLVRSEADLFAATRAAFDAIQKRLTGDTPSSSLLWDTHSQRPKVEDEVSDYLRNELQSMLQRRGVIVNREVQVRRVRQSGMPERTDLRIEANSSRENSEQGELITIVGEVKGCWNRDIETSIKTQLVDRYMADIHTNVGVYIAVWFDLESWTEDDSRRSKAAKYGSAQGLRTALEAKAAEQTDAGREIAVVVLDASLARPNGGSNSP
nr:hypothetical protein [Rhodococcus wratislaviensis]GLK39070.1 hypothetical protein GCM10017611_59400 [Rhodococcus wratislaviensis]